MKLHPLNDLVLIKPYRMKSMTVGGIHIPESAKSGVLILAKVIEVGLGRDLEGGTRRNMDVKEGDDIAFSGGAPVFSIKDSPIAALDGKRMPELALIDIGHIFCVMKSEPDDDLHITDDGEVPAALGIAGQTEESPMILSTE